MQVVRTPFEDLKQSPEDGCYIRGLFVEGARWDMDTFKLADSKPKKLFTDFPVMLLVPTADRVAPLNNIYECPVYKTLTRAGIYQHHPFQTCACIS